MTEFDVIVLGAGSTGENVADRVVQGGLSAAIVESELVGGECSYWACMPSKALLRSGQALDAARAVGGAKQAVSGELDVQAVLDRRNGFTSNWKDDGQVQWLDGVGVTLVRGQGRLTGPKSVEVRAADGTVTTLTARHAVVLAVGSEPFLPPIDGLLASAPWTARDATSAKQLPARLAVLGGGVVGVEMATAYASFGAQVTVLEADAQLLAKYEPFVSAAVRDGLTRRGVSVRTSAKVVGVRRPAPDGPVTLTTDGGQEVTADEFLVAVGRRARTTGIGVETVGLTAGAYVAVDDTLQATAVPGGWLYAAGDVNGRALLTHMGKYQARACGDAITARARGEHVDGAPWSRFAATADHAAVPQVVFSDPEVAAVGLTERAARDAGLSVRTAEYEIGNVAGAAVYADGYQGHAKIVVDTDRDVLVGVTMVGPVTGEMLHAATVAVVGEVPLARLWHAVPSYPTISEVWLRLLETYGR
ncbi:MAG TPA: NAD(P)/FAD-dependent oxidoreductase [Mycobacteriales bacterium]|nr:NAD(P)/FAD-dependent oxidoreductase [Mycobacteriales bacterium]